MDPLASVEIHKMARELSNFAGDHDRIPLIDESRYHTQSLQNITNIMLVFVVFVCMFTVTVCKNNIPLTPSNKLSEK